MVKSAHIQLNQFFGSPVKFHFLRYPTILMERLIFGQYTCEHTWWSSVRVDDQGLMGAEGHEINSELLIPICVCVWLGTSTLICVPHSKIIIHHHDQFSLFKGSIHAAALLMHIRMRDSSSAHLQKGASWAAFPKFLLYYYKNASVKHFPWIYAYAYATLFHCCIFSAKRHIRAHFYF